MIRVIRVIRSLVAFVFVQKYVIEAYVSVSFCLRAIRVIRSLVAFVFVQKYVIEVYVRLFGLQKVPFKALTNALLKSY